MVTYKGRTAFGFIPEAGCYSNPTDTFSDMLKWRTELPIDKLIRHIETLDEGLMCRLGRSRDVITGEYFPAGLFDDGDFVFANDVLRYLKRGDIKGIPKEYEEYLLAKHADVFQ